MRPSAVRLIGVCAAATVALTAAAASGDKRCGWFVNPTPGNFWLVDPEGDWAIAWQGQPQPPGVEMMPDMSTGGWVETNGHSGYGCGCVSGEVDRAEKKFIRIDGFQPKSLALCRADKRLPAYE